MDQSKKSRVFIIVLLAISLIAPSIPQIQAETDEWQVSADSDSCRRVSTVLQFTYVSVGKDYIGGARFLGVNIPQGSTIISADLGLCPRNVYSFPVLTKIKAQDSDTTITFSTPGDFDARPRTSGTDWDIGSATVNVWINGSCKDEIQVVINREGWTAGNSIVIFIEDDSSSNHLHTYAHSDTPSKAPKLYITWGLAIEPPSDPDLLFGAGFNASSPYVDLQWNHSLVDVQFFEVQNSSDAESWTYLGQSTTANYTDSQVVNGTERYYKVRACNQTDGDWYNSSWADVNFETVYFIMAGADGEAPPVDDYSIIFLAIGLILTLCVAFLYVRDR